MLVKNNKGRIVAVSKEQGEYLLADNPTKTIEGVPQMTNKGQRVAVRKSAHEKGYTKLTKEEIKAFEAKQKAAQKAAQSDAKIKAENEALKKKIAEMEAKAENDSQVMADDGPQEEPKDGKQK